MSEVVTLRGIRCVVIECGTCGVVHAFSEARYDSAYKEGGFWHCPNGHSRGWQNGHDKQELVQLRLERDRLKQRTAQLQDEVAENEARAKKAEKARIAIINRTTAGVCPCCDRQFANLQRHMKTKHQNVVPLEQKTA